MDRIAHSVGTSQPRSPVTTVIAQWAHEHSGHGGREGDYAWVQRHRFLFTKGDLAVATGAYAIHQQQRPALSLQYGTVPRGDHPAPWWQVDYIRWHPS